MGRQVVRRREDIEKNVAYFWGLNKGSARPRLSRHAAQMLGRAHNFVAVRFVGIGFLFAPSRFVGYLGDNFKDHEADNRKDGGVTDPAISRALGVDAPTVSTVLEREFVHLCSRYNVKPQKRQRDYWPKWDAHWRSSATSSASPMTPARRKSRKGTESRPTWPRLIPPKPETTANQHHNRLQEHFFNLLVAKYGEDHVSMEEDFVDLWVRHPNLEAFIELKSDPRPRYAIREALGQLLDYAFAAKENQESHSFALIVAAPGKLDEESQRFIEFISAKTGLDLRYIRVHETATKCPL